MWIGNNCPNTGFISRNDFCCFIYHGIALWWWRLSQQTGISQLKSGLESFWIISSAAYTKNVLAWVAMFLNQSYQYKFFFSFSIVLSQNVQFKTKASFNFYRQTNTYGLTIATLQLNKSKACQETGLNFIHRTCKQCKCNLGNFGKQQVLFSYLKKYSTGFDCIWGHRIGCSHLASNFQNFEGSHVTAGSDFENLGSWV